MSVSIYSILVTLVWFNVSVWVCTRLRTSKRFSYQFGLWPIGAAIVAGFLRLFFPLELPFTKVVHFEFILPDIRDFLTRPYSFGNWFSVSIIKFLLAIWVIGACIHLVRLAKFVWKDRQAVYQLPTLPSQRIGSLIAEVVGPARYRYIISPDVPVPFVAGLFTPVYVLPLYIASFSDDEIRSVMRHEKQHFAHHDVWIKLFTEIIICVFWWDKPVSHLRENLDQFLEVNCDLTVTKDMEEAERAEYLETLEKSVLHKGTIPLPALFSGLYKTDDTDDDGDFDLKQRFHLVKTYNKKRNTAVLAASCVVLGLLWFASLLLVVQPLTYPPELEITELEIDKFAAGVDDVDGAVGDMYFKHESDGRYVLYINGKPAFDYSEEEFLTQPVKQIPVID